MFKDFLAFIYLGLQIILQKETIMPMLLHFDFL